MPETEKPEHERPASPWAFQVAVVAGIPVRLHITFLLFLVWIGWTGQSQSGWQWPIYVLAVFFCVVLHEFGHALTAKKYGIKTTNITLYPIGGVAMLESRPTAKQELWVTIMGPAVNVVIAGLLYLYMWISPQQFQLTSDIRVGGILPALFFTNISLALFNLIPAFPMDGGRILRAALSLRLGELRATRIAAGVGQVVAIGLGVAGIITSQVILMLIAFFVFLVAGQELTSTVTRSLLAGRKVRDAMMRNFATLPHGTTLQEASELLIAGSQTDFPVTSGSDVLGILERSELSIGLTEDGPHAYVAGRMNRNANRCRPDDDLEWAAEQFAAAGRRPVLVMEGDDLVGMLTQENLSEFIMLQDAASRRKKTG